MLENSLQKLLLWHRYEALCLHSILDQRYVKGHTGIICKLCMHPVSKSYSCYKLAHAPKEIRHLFDDGSHCVRVCRRCLPYKSPKRSEKNTQKKLHKTIEKLLK